MEGQNPNPNDGYVYLQEPQVKHFVNYCLLGGARIRKMDLHLNDPMWPGSCNPSIMYDKKTEKFKFIVRNVNYVMHGAQDSHKALSNWGPVLYSVPTEDGRNLKTRNFIGETANPMSDEWTFNMIHTTPYNPRWEFWGEEDARLIRWDEKLYTTGVRRDDNTDGRGRMELMRISENMEHPQEISRLKVKGLGDDNTYCEKNWMPIMDLPFHYVQLSNPTVVVKTDPRTGVTQEVVRKEQRTGFIDENFDLLRGSSQVVRWRDHWITLVHTCELWFTANDRKFARYCHVFVEWDDDWNITRMSPLFSFADFNVEFTCGMAYKDGKFYIPFAIQDNFPFLMEVDENIIDKFIDNDETVAHSATTSHPRMMAMTDEINALFDPNATQQELWDTGHMYFNEGLFAAAYCVFMKAAEKFNYTYGERFFAARSIANLGHRDAHEIGMWIQTIEHDPNRPEAYLAAAMFYYCRDKFIEARFFAQKGYEILQRDGKHNQLMYYSREDFDRMYYNCIMQTSDYPQAVKWYDEHNIEHNQNRRVL